jgi:hypothetical protein
MRTLPVAATTAPTPARVDPDLILVPAVHNTMDEDEDSPDMILRLLASVPSKGLDALRRARGGRCNHRCACRIPPARKDRDRPLSAMPGSTTNSFPTPRDLRPVSSFAVFASFRSPMLINYPPASQLLYVTVLLCSMAYSDVHVEWDSLSDRMLTSANPIHVARERPYRPPISQIHPLVHSARHASHIWREDGDVRFRTGSKRAPW